jgi:hypothetical protein
MMSERWTGERYHPSCHVVLSTRGEVCCGGGLRGIRTSEILCVCDAPCGRLSYGLAICECVYH